MKKIKVQTRLNIFFYILLFLFIVSIIGTIFYYIILNNTEFFSSSTKIDAWELVFVSGLLLPLLFREVMQKGKYVSEMIFTNDTLRLVYKDKGKIIDVRSIMLSDITSFNIRTSAETYSSTRQNFYVIFHSINILLKNKEKIFIEVRPTQFSFGCSYQLLLDLLTVSQYIPNFSYDFENINENIIEDINYFKNYGKRMPLIKQKGMYMVILYFVLMSLIIAFLVFLFGFSFLTSKSDFKDNSYINIYSQIDEYRNNNDYATALKLVSDAKVLEPNDYNVYLSEAYIYEKMQDYKKEIECAEKALTLLNSKEKSRYDQAFHKDGLIAKYIFKSKNHGFVRAYTLLGYANYKINNYSEAVKNYTFVINITTYKYSDVYLYRGVSLYYLGNKEKALQDFFKQQEIINDYMVEMPNARYPQYDKKDLDRIILWIKACKN